MSLQVGFEWFRARGPRARFLAAFLACGGFVTGSWQTSNLAWAQDKPAATESKPASDDDFKGSEAFEQASRLRVTESSKESLGKVIELCKKALELGLDELDTADAKKMLGAASFQRAQKSLEELAGARLPAARVTKVTGEAMQDLQAAIEADPDLVDAYVMKARIHLLRQEIGKGGEALDTARSKLQAMVDAGERDPDIKKKLSEVIIMRSVSRQDVDERIEDLLKAIDADPENERAIQLTVESLASVGRNDEAEAVVRKFLETDPNNDYALRRLMLILVQAEKMDQASSFLNEKIEKHPELSVLYSLRSNLFLMKASTGNPEPQDRKGWLESGKADCDKAVELDAENLDAYLNRARICLALKDYDQAKKDLDYLQEKRPEIPDIAFLKMDLAIQEKRVGDAIAELERLVQLNPENRLLLMQLASMYQMDDRPRKALRIADRLINAEPTDWQALRLRGDVLLALGRHADAINDYEEAVKNIPEDEEDLSGVLNNLSWVLSTSPEDSVRNGDRALEAGLKACELTEYKKSHILSTLAAAYAELGQFDKAIEWSSKAVELGAKEEAEQLDQLKEELKNYQDKKPWREKKETEEKQTKPAKPDGGIDT
ncbi:MAG: tetratricopeptide repeat protein [Planctomycetota bacterium]